MCAQLGTFQEKTLKMLDWSVNFTLTESKTFEHTCSDSDASRNILTWTLKKYYSDSSSYNVQINEVRLIRGTPVTGSDYRIKVYVTTQWTQLSFEVCCTIETAIKQLQNGT